MVRCGVWLVGVSAIQHRFFPLTSEMVMQTTGRYTTPIASSPPRSLLCVAASSARFDSLVQPESWKCAGSSSGTVSDR